MSQLSHSPGPTVSGVPYFVAASNISERDRGTIVIRWMLDIVTHKSPLKKDVYLVVLDMLEQNGDHDFLAGVIDFDICGV